MWKSWNRNWNAACTLEKWYCQQCWSRTRIFKYVSDGYLLTHLYTIENAYTIDHLGVCYVDPADFDQSVFCTDYTTWVFLHEPACMILASIRYKSQKGNYRLGLNGCIKHQRNDVIYGTGELSFIKAVPLWDTGINSADRSDVPCNWHWNWAK